MGLSLKKQWQINPEKVKEGQSRRQAKSRQVKSAHERLNKFRKHTMFNAIFVCTCCPRNLFNCNVTTFDSRLREKMDDKNPGLFGKAIEEVINITINGKTASYICHACKNHLRRGKLPPMSAKNGLHIEVQDPELELTELEANLIAKRIIFMKIFQLPKSRWTALKDKIINIPIKDDDIVNTITSLPRTPDEAGLIEVDLKRK